MLRAPAQLISGIEPLNHPHPAFGPPLPHGEWREGVRGIGSAADGISDDWMESLETQIRPRSTRMMRITNSAPTSPPGPYPHLLLYGHVGRTPSRIRMRRTIRSVPIKFGFSVDSGKCLAQFVPGSCYFTMMLFLTSLTPLTPRAISPARFFWAAVSTNPLS